MPKFDPYYRSMSTDELLNEYQSLERNGNAWAMKRTMRITEELERRDVFINKDRDGIFLYDEEKEEKENE